MKTEISVGGVVLSAKPAIPATATFFSRWAVNGIVVAQRIGYPDTSRHARVVYRMLGEHPTLVFPHPGSVRLSDGAKRRIIEHATEAMDTALSLAGLEPVAFHLIAINHPVTCTDKPQGDLARQLLHDLSRKQGRGHYLAAAEIESRMKENGLAVHLTASSCFHCYLLTIADDRERVLDAPPIEIGRVITSRVVKFLQHRYPFVSTTAIPRRRAMLPPHPVRC